MKTGSLRNRVALVTISLLTLVLVVVVAAVTLAYQSSLERDLRLRLTTAGSAVDRAGSAAAAKPLVEGLALEGIATNIGAATTSLPAKSKRSGRPAPIKPGASVQTRGSLLVLEDVLPDGSHVVFSASHASVSRAVDRLLLVEVLVALGVLALATLVVLHTTRRALRPLTQVIETATRIAAGDKVVRLKPSRTDTELGSMAAAFDRMVDALETAVETAERSDASTRRFLADASHELRTPIAALQATAETLLREQPERPERDRIEATLSGEAARLGRLVDDLLGLARVEGRPKIEPLDLHALVKATAADAANDSSSVRVSIEHSGDMTVHGDADGLARLMRNLLENALRAATPSGHVNVSLRQLTGNITARITDDGPGIPDADRERIFERFVRLGPRSPGTGLGLAIARRIAREHGGDLTCDLSHVGGSFTLHLPR